MGEPIQILKYDTRNKLFKLQYKELKNLLENEDLKECNISIISIVGAFRKGKSFFLNFLIRYLKAEYEQNFSKNWLGEDNTPLDDGFRWRSGLDRHTTGIWIWSKIFTKVLPNGEKIGLIVMDTQGIFDGKSTPKDHATIFTLSTMLSSVQIFNLSNQIQEDNLQHLQLFTEYGKLAMKKSSRKPFQKLLFLIRDWGHEDDHPFGSAGGRDYLHNQLKISEDLSDELSEVRSHLKSCFEDIDCFLMPTPGKIATRSSFNGKLEDMDIEFKTSLKELVPMLLAPENIVIKTINGVQVKGKNLLPFIESYWKMFENDQIILTSESILGATARVNNFLAKDAAEDYYMTEMRNFTQFAELGEIIDQHLIVKAEALDIVN